MSHPDHILKQEFDKLYDAYQLLCERNSFLVTRMDFLATENLILHKKLNQPLSSPLEAQRMASFTKTYIRELMTLMISSLALNDEALAYLESFGIEDIDFELVFAELIKILSDHVRFDENEEPLWLKALIETRAIPTKFDY